MTAASESIGNGAAACGDGGDDRQGRFRALQRQLWEAHEAEVEVLRQEVYQLRQLLSARELALAGREGSLDAEAPRPRPIKVLDSPLHSTADGVGTAEGVMEVGRPPEQETLRVEGEETDREVATQQSVCSARSCPTPQSGHQTRILRSTVSMEKLQRTDTQDRLRLSRGSTRPFHLRLPHEVAHACLIVGNAIFIGISTSAEVEGKPFPFRTTMLVRLVTCLSFCAELMARICHQKLREFCLGEHRGVNLLDSILVIGLIIESTITIAYGREITSLLRQLSVFRIVRVLQLLRFLELLRKTSCLVELHIFVECFRNSLNAICWILLLMTALVYCTALVLLQAAADVCARHEYGIQTPMCTHFGSLGGSMMTLFQAVFGGLLWGEVVDALLPAGVFYQIALVVFMVIMLLLVCNIVIGIVLACTERASQNELDHRISSEMHDRSENILALRDIFQEMDINGSGEINRDELNSACQDLRIDALLSSLGLRVFDVHQMFDLLDSNHTGLVSMEDFIIACQRMQGGTRAVDMIFLQQQNARMFKQVKEIHRALVSELNQTNEHQSPSPLQTWTQMRSRDSNRQSAPLIKQAFNSDSTPMTPSRSAKLRKCTTSFTASRITLVEMRAMTMPELCELEALVKMGCSSEGWEHPRTGAALSPGQVDLYAVVHNYIAPCTALVGVRLCGLSKASYKRGQLVKQPARRAVGTIKADSEGPDIEVDVMRGKFCLEGPIYVDEVDCGIPSSVIVPESLSYKELLGNGERKPLWYCTHWWGEAVLDFLACIREHAHCRVLSDEKASYWICGYALRQNSAKGELDAQDIRESPFFKAMSLAEGILLVVDSQATVFRRIWCDFELYVNLTSIGDLLDIVTLPDGAKHARLFSGTPFPYESLSDQRRRETRFPKSILLAGMRVVLQDGGCSREEDKRVILASFSGDQLENANRRLRSLFAKAAWPLALRLGLVADFDSSSPGTVSLPEILSADKQRTQLSFSFAHMEEVTSDAAHNLAMGLAETLEELQLSFEGCQNVEDQTVKVLSRSLPKDLRVLSLDFLGCKAITNAGVSHLAHALPMQLEELTLHFDMCTGVTFAGLRELAQHLPNGLRKFNGTFLGTTVDDTFNSVSELRKAALGEKSLLQRWGLVGFTRGTP